MSNLNERITAIALNHKTALSAVVPVVRETIQDFYANNFSTESIKHLVNAFGHSPKTQTAIIKVVGKTSNVRIINAKNKGIKINGEFVIVANSQKGKKRIQIESENACEPVDLPTTNFDQDYLDQDELWEVATILLWGAGKKEETRTDAEIEHGKELNKQMKAIKDLLKFGNTTSDAVKMQAIDALKTYMGI